MPDPTLYFYFLPAVKVHLVQNTSSLAQFCFHSIQSNPYSALMFHALLLKSKTQIQESICTQNRIHTMTDKCKYSVFTKPSYKWFIFVTKILLASSATTFAHRQTSSSNTYWLIQAKTLLLGHWYEIMALYYVKSILTEISASRQDRRVLQKSKIIRIEFLSKWGMLQTSRYV